jgi:hypothetical protein
MGATIQMNDNERASRKKLIDFQNLGADRERSNSKGIRPVGVRNMFSSTLINFA